MTAKKAAQMRQMYAECSMPRPKPDMSINEDLLNTIASNYRTLPTFEKTLFDEVFIKYYSLDKNDFLKCRWKIFKKNIIERKKEPFYFPKNSDLHFYNQHVQFIPQLSLSAVESFRLTAKPGPGVDHRGLQRAIPNELLYKRGLQKTERPPKLMSKRKQLREHDALKKDGDVNAHHSEQNTHNKGGNIDSNQNAHKMAEKRLVQKKV